MSATEAHTTSRNASVAKVDVKLEIQISPVSDVDRSNDFYERNTISRIGRPGGSHAVER
jgi:hypothetical protein